MLHEIKDRFESRRLQQKLQNAIEQTEHRREIFIEMRTIALSIEDSSDRDLALQGIVKAQVEVDYYSQIKADYSKDALVTAGMIEQADARNSALLSIALRQVETDNIERAIVFAQIIEERAAQRNWAFSEITRHLCMVRNIERALTTARMIEDADQRAVAFVAIASAMAGRSPHRGEVTRDQRPYFRASCYR